jgi:hypothetical protein
MFGSRQAPQNLGVTHAYRPIAPRPPTMLRKPPLFASRNHPTSAPTLATSSPPERLSFIKVLADYELVFCTKCTSAVWLSNLDYHLAMVHILTPQQRSSTVKHIRNLSISLAKDQDGVKKLPNGSTPLDILPAPKLGLECTFAGCGYACRTERNIFRHCRKFHAIQNPKAYGRCNGVLGRPAYLQTWHNHKGQEHDFWTVKMDPLTFDTQPLTPPSSSPIQAQTLCFILCQKSARLLGARATRRALRL